MSLRRISIAAVFLSVIFLQAGCVLTGEAVLPPAAPPVDTRASRPKELPADKTAELCQAAGEELEKQGLHADAATQYENARQHDPRRGPVVARRLAVIYDRLGDDARALPEYKQALTAAPHDADLLNDFGYYYYQRGNLPEAEKCFKQALEANPKHQRATVNLGLTLGKQGRMDVSLETFRRVLPASQAYCNVGVLLAQQGKPAEARRALEEALRLEPGLQKAQAVLDHLGDAASAPPPSASTTPIPIIPSAGPSN
jgi:Tfp pilus assembly protein PilF